MQNFYNATNSHLEVVFHQFATPLEYLGPTGLIGCISIDVWGSRARLNFPEEHDIKELPTPKVMRMDTKTEENEHPWAKLHMEGPLVHRYCGDPNMITYKHGMFGSNGLGRQPTRKPAPPAWASSTSRRTASGLTMTLTTRVG
jgi:hypothetical protein